MYANPKETTSLRLDGTMKRRSKELPALHGMTLRRRSRRAERPR